MEGIWNSKNFMLFKEIIRIVLHNSYPTASHDAKRPVVFDRVEICVACGYYL